MVKNATKNKKKRLFWDTAAGTPLDKKVLDVMNPWLSTAFGNPASIHQEGLVANQAVEAARRKISEILFCQPDEIIFTGSGTESDNLAILGLAKVTTKKHIITSAIEHKAVLEPCRHLQKEGQKITYLKVDKDGQVNLKELKDALTKDTFLVSVMMVNNEIGSVQPIREIAKIIRHWRKINGTHLPYFHTDACQAPRFLDINVAKLGVDLLSFNGSKIYGPKGIGALYVRRGVILSPIIWGGGQERGWRSGTLNVPGIIGLAQALEICQKQRSKENARLEKIQKKLIAELKKIPEVQINGPEAGSGVRNCTPLRIPNNINFSTKNFEGEQLVIELDAKGIAVSSGSACSHDSGESSNTLRAIGCSEEEADGAIRISLPREVSTTDIFQFVRALKSIINKYQKIQI